jgi:hypothetical protein
MKSYTLTAHIGTHWRGPDITLGSFRWHWVARLYAELYLLAYPCRAVTVARLDS